MSILIAAPLAFFGAGGAAGLTAVLPETHFTLTGRLGLAAAIGLFLPTMLLLLGESGMYQKFYAARSESAARKAVLGMIVGVILIEVLIDATAVFAAAATGTTPPSAAGPASIAAPPRRCCSSSRASGCRRSPAACCSRGRWRSSSRPPPPSCSFPSTGLARDVYQRFLRPGAGSAAVIRFQRFALIGMAALSLLITTRFESILDMALYAYTMVGAAVTPALLAAFLWRRATPAAAWSRSPPAS